MTVDLTFKYMHVISCSISIGSKSSGWRIFGRFSSISQPIALKSAKVGLDHYEHRSWTAWHRHMRLVFLAQLFLLRLQIKFKKKPPP
jgi:hypothetical protein